VTAERSISLNYEALNQLDFGSRASDLAHSRVVCDQLFEISAMASDNSGCDSPTRSIESRKKRAAFLAALSESVRTVECYGV
jgi:hypothetical protein